MARGSVGGAYRGKHGNIRGNFRGGASSNNRGRGGFRARGGHTGTAGPQGGGPSSNANVLLTDDGGTARGSSFFLSSHPYLFLVLPVLRCSH